MNSPETAAPRSASLDELRATIVARYPGLESSAFASSHGWLSTAVDVDDRLIFKFPRGAAAHVALRREAALLSTVRPHLSMPVPDLVLHAGPPLFSVHEKLRGGQLLPAAYASLGEVARERLAADLALFYAELHGLEATSMRAAGAIAIDAWQPLGVVVEKALPTLPGLLRGRAEAAVAAFGQLPPDPCGETYGFFDGHGWNMAFDFEASRLNGIYDFADLGFGPLHQEFVYSNLIAADLTARIIDHYERRTGRRIDRRRVGVLTWMHRLSELAEYAADPEHAPTMIKAVASWAADEAASRPG